MLCQINLTLEVLRHQTWPKMVSGICVVSDQLNVRTCATSKLTENGFRHCCQNSPGARLLARQNNPGARLLAAQNSPGAKLLAQQNIPGASGSRQQAWSHTSRSTQQACILAAKSNMRKIHWENSVNNDDGMRAPRTAETEPRQNYCKKLRKNYNNALWHQNRNVHGIVKNGTRLK